MLVPISVGELIDKITILEIKAERIADPARRANVRREDFDWLDAARTRDVARRRPNWRRCRSLEQAAVNPAPVWEIGRPAAPGWSATNASTGALLNWRAACIVTTTDGRR